jgi:hypothetical protein
LDLNGCAVPRQWLRRAAPNARRCFLLIALPGLPTNAGLSRPTSLWFPDLRSIGIQVGDYDYCFTRRLLLTVVPRTRPRRDVCFSHSLQRLHGHYRYGYG